MTNNQPRGTVQRVFTNGAGEVVALIRWYRGDGPAQAKGDGFRDGQSVTVRGGEVVPT
jgi:hypothetical protein